ncbi:uncharacterized protein BDR25DRAFT_315165 [Lindgomyces ingoldianus]|uniref:Uncharacterized protein n=1 Tax=Lindgomyces ingoldianus TaxID=673940 RepID=A0ACB6QTY7_9PLEO|nr:uncharacterized protein BDR25DRAFT_315165 [Lindgomyces ingoldianus]KAF2469550.1 hypothetical protein BDR25DRAFT_315165 [Lindgomyces ingoldianus]
MDSAPGLLAPGVVLFAAIVSESQAGADPQSQQINAALAARFMTTIMQKSNTYKDYDMKLSSPQDFALLWEVLFRHEMFQELRRFLQCDDRERLRVLVPHERYRRSASLLTLQKQHQWDQVLEYCHHWLQDVYRNEDQAPLDWAPFDALLELSCEDPERYSLSPSKLLMHDMLIKCVDRYWRSVGAILSELVASAKTSKVRQSREVLLATILWKVQAGRPGWVLGSNISTLFPANSESLELGTSFLNYISEYASKPCCFNDLRPILDKMSEPDQMECLDLIEKRYEERMSLMDCNSRFSRQQASEGVSLLKLLYLRATFEEPGPTRWLLSESLRLLQRLDSTDLENMKEVSILAATCCLQLEDLSPADSHMRRQHLHLILAAILLSQYHKLDPDDRQVIVLSMRVNIALGTPSIALSLLQDVRLKGILFDTIGHELLTRVSSFAPIDIDIPVRKGAQRTCEDLLGTVDRSLRFYDTWERDLSERPVDSTERPQHGDIFDVTVMRQKARESFTRRLIVIEQRRLVRARNREKDLGDLYEFGLWLRNVSDSRAWDFVELLEPKPTQAIPYLSFQRPVPGKTWLATRILHDDTLNIIGGHVSFPPSDIDTAEKVASSCANLGEELDTAEMMVEDGWKILRSLARKSGIESNVRADTELASLMVQLGEELSRILSTIKGHQSLYGRCTVLEFLQKVFLTFELLRGIRSFVKWHISNLAPKRLNRESLSTLEGAVESCWMACVESTQRLIIRLREQGLAQLIDEIEEDAQGRAIMEHFSKEIVIQELGNLQKHRLAILDTIVNCTLL